ncbi:hypothetical protein HanLR1_Chr17g0659861 [Helianthus annuus]|nr:hypothetical protein HanLR1_Chr17g0659861 [Helianthus annuus]
MKVAKLAKPRGRKWHFIFSIKLNFCFVIILLLQVLHSLLAIEATSLSIATSRKVVLLISKIQMDLSAKRIRDAYIPLVFNAVIGIFHNRFNYLWNPAMECFVVLVNDYPSPVWETCMKFLDKCVSNFASYRAHSDQDNSELHGSHDGMSFSISLNKMPFSSLRFGQFATFVQRFVLPHLDPKGLKSCHFHPAH